MARAACAWKISIELAAWNAPGSTNTADPQQLRLGLRASASSAPWNAWWLAELLAFDLPQSGSGGLALMAGQHAEFLLQPVPALPETAGISISADSVGIGLDWIPGGSIAMHATVSNLSVTAGTTVNIPSLVFPPPAGFDIANPLPTLGVSAADLASLFRLLFSRGLFSWAGEEEVWHFRHCWACTEICRDCKATWPTLRRESLRRSTRGSSCLAEPTCHECFRGWFAVPSRTHSRGCQAG